jgi:uncharacterized protein YndB with AHSA1/START domain
MEVRLMAKLERSITINAPAAKIFEYVNVPTNLPEIWPSMVEARDVQRLPNGGNSFRWVYKMAGVRFEGTSEDTECVDCERVVSETKGGIESKLVWAFEPEDPGTKTTFQAEYTVPIPLLGRLAERVIVKMNEHESEVLLANLKARMEA